MFTPLLVMVLLTGDFSLLLDIKASHHIAFDLAKFEFSMPYIGSCGVMLGNGSKIPIHHIGSIMLNFVKLLSFHEWYVAFF